MYVYKLLTYILSFLGAQIKFARGCVMNSVTLRAEDKKTHTQDSSVEKGINDQFPVCMLIKGILTTIVP